MYFTEVFFFLIAGNYSFMHGRAVLRDLKFLEEFQEIIRKNTKTSNFANLLLYCFIIIDNMDVIEQYPDTLSLQLSSRICHDPLVMHYESESIRSFPLLPLYSYEKLKNRVKSLHVNNQAINRLIFSQESPHVFMLTEKKQIKLINYKNLAMLGEMKLDMSRAHDDDDDDDFKIRICLCTKSNVGDSCMADLNGHYVLFNLNFIRVINLSGSVVFELESSSDIDTLYILSPKHLLVCYEKSLQIFDVNLKVKVYESLFETAIEVVDSNINSHIVFLPEYKCKDIYMLVTLVTGVVEVFRFASEAAILVSLCIVPSFNGIEIISLAIDEKYFIDCDKRAADQDTCVFKFATLLQNYSLCTYAIEKQGVKFRFDFQNFLCPLVMRKYMTDTARIMDFKNGLLLLDCGRNETVFTISDVIIIFNIGM